MSILHTVAIFAGIPILVYVVLIGLGTVYPRSGNKQVPVYHLGGTWDRDPILWTATDDVLRGSDGGHGRHSTPSIGASAHGTW